MLDYIALGILFFVVISKVYIVIAIHDFPYNIAKSIVPSFFSLHTFYWGDWHRDETIKEGRTVYRAQ